MQQPKFESLFYNPRNYTWPVGNQLVGLPLIASVQIAKPTISQIKAEKKDYEDAKKIYETHLKKGNIFKPIGKNANRNICAIITGINAEKSYITWKQQLTAEQIKEGYKPASGKFSVSGFIALVRNKQVEFIK
jgi:hypothetical protein